MYLIAFMVCVALCEYRIDHLSREQPWVLVPIRQAAMAIGASSFESRLDSWAQINTAATAGEIDHITAGILKSLDMNFTELPAKDLNVSSRREYLAEHGGTVVRFQVEADHLKDSTVVFFTCINSGGDSDPGGWVQKLENIGGWDWHHYFLYSAYIGESDEIAGYPLLLETVMHELDAQTKEVFLDERCCSQTGYSQKLSQSVSPVWIKNRKVNVQAAIRNQSDRRTVLMIGSPLIMGEY